MLPIQAIRFAMLAILTLMTLGYAATVQGPNLPATTDLGIPSWQNSRPASQKALATFGRLHGATGPVSFCNGDRICAVSKLWAGPQRPTLMGLPPVA